MLAALLPYKLIFEALAFFALIASVSFGVHRFLEHEQQIGYDKAVAEYTVKENAALKEAQLKTESLAKQLAEAQNHAQEREQTIKSLAVASSAASLSLRDTINNISRGVPTATLDALRNSTTALSAVLVSCQDQYRSVAESADRHASDVKTLTDAWPK